MSVRVKMKCASCGYEANWVEKYDNDYYDEYVGFNMIIGDEPFLEITSGHCFKIQSIKNSYNNSYDKKTSEEDDCLLYGCPKCHTVLFK